MTVALTPAQRSSLWRAGKTFYLLHSGQLEVYRKYRAWESDSFEKRKAGVELPGMYPRVYVLDCSRRFGKDFLSLQIADENARQRPKSIQTYATAYQKDINEIVVPLMDIILQDCPEAMRPIYRTSYQGTANGYYYPNGAVIKLVGVESRPASLRGRFSDGFFFSEAGFIGKLEEALVRVCMPQLQGRLHASILMNSTPPEAPAHFWDTHCCPDAAENGRYSRKTIDDNPMLSLSEKEEFIRAAGGRRSETCRREYFTERIRSATSTVVPEFSRATHVRKPPFDPDFALGFTVIDPGVRDLCAVSTGWFDFERAKMVIRRSWSARNANTNAVADAIRALEAETFSELKFWNSQGFQENPWCRFSDTEARLILDLSTVYDLKVVNVDKSAGKEAALHAFRSAVQLGKIEWHPDAADAIDHVEAAIWNKERSDWARNDVHGHFDQLDVAIYAWRMCNKIDNPLPPQGVVMAQHFKPDQLHAPRHTLERKRKLTEAWSELWGKRRFQTAGRK